MNSHGTTPGVSSTPHQLGCRFTKAAPALQGLRQKCFESNTWALRSHRTEGRAQSCAQMFNQFLILFLYSSSDAIKVLNSEQTLNALLDLHSAVDFNWREMIFFSSTEVKSTWEEKKVLKNPPLKNNQAWLCLTPLQWYFKLLPTTKALVNFEI